jgi:hypothetical protein
MSEPINSIIKRIGSLGRRLDTITEEAIAIRAELLGLLEDVQNEIKSRGEIVDRIDAGLKESFERAKTEKLSSS